MSNFWELFAGVSVIAEAIIKVTVDKVVEKTGLTKIKYCTIVNGIVCVLGIVFSIIINKPELTINYWKDCVVLCGGSLLLVKYGYDFVKELMEKAHNKNV